MLKNYFKIILRNLVRQKLYSIINIAGLSIGMACCIFIMLWVMNELSFDRFHEKADSIYRVIQEQKISVQSNAIAITQAALAPALKSDFPEVIASTRIYNETRKLIIKNNNSSFYEDKACFTDPSFFEIFSFLLTIGDAKNALKDPFSVILNEDIAKKYFGDSNPLGKILQVDLFHGFQNFKVTGVLKNIPENSHLQFNILFSFDYFYTLMPDFGNWDYACNYFTYVLLDKSTSLIEFNKKISHYLKNHIPESKDILSLQPLTEIHLHSNVKFDADNNSDIKYIYIFSIIGIVILIISSFNFINLAIALGGKRAAEVGIRKVVGANKFEIIKQFFCESTISVFLALLLSLFTVEIFLPLFNDISGKNLSLSLGYNMFIILFLIFLLIIISLLAGAYPSFYLSSFNPAKILKGKKDISLKNRKPALRKILVIFQFVISIILITGTIVINKQVDYIKNKDIGFDKEHIIYVPLRGSLIDKYNIFKDEAKKYPGIINVSAANILPNQGNQTIIMDWEGKNSRDALLIHMTGVDYDYFETMNIDIVEGRGFTKEFSSDSKEGVVVNEEAIKQMGMKNPIGKRFGERRIIGIAKNYHFTSLKEKIEPIFLYHKQNKLLYSFIRVKSNEIFNTINNLKKLTYNISPEIPFEFRFLNDELNSLYLSEERISKLFTAFTFLAFFITCIGLFALISFITEQRTKEIGIRKVLGSTVTGIIFMLSKEFIKWVLLANVIAWPIAYYFSDKWLSDFAYSIDINVWVFITSGIIALVIALLTVGYQAIRAATANPVDSLRYE